MIFNDITDVKRLAFVEYQHLRMQLRQSSVTHELVTPLKCITSFAMELSRKEMDKTNRDVIKLIASTSKLVHAQVNELLDKNLLDKKMVIPKLQNTSLVTLVKDAIDILK